MPHPLAILFLDSLAIGIAVSTFALECVLVLDPSGLGGVLASLGPVVLSLIWLHVAAVAAPFGTLVLLWRDRGE